MSIRISGKNLDIGDSLRAQVEERVGAALTKYAEHGHGTGHVTVSRDGFGFRTDCVLNLGRGMLLEASGQAADAYSSFDQSALRIEKRLRRYKRRLKDRLGNGRDRRAGHAAAESNYAILQAPSEDEPEEEGFKPIVIAETTKPLNSLAVSEAVSELDLTGAPVLVFRHAGHGRVNVVYRRRDGSIGWIDPPALEA